MLSPYTPSISTKTIGIRIRIDLPDHHLHLERVSLALSLQNNRFQHLLFIQSKAPGKIADVRPQHDAGEQVRTARHELPLEVPTVDATIASIARASNDVVILGLLDGDKFGDKFGLYASEKGRR